MTFSKIHTILFALIAPIMIGACGGDDDPIGTSENATPYTEFPTLVAPVSIENESAIKVLVPDGSGGWTDVTADVSEIPCTDLLDEFQSDEIGDSRPAIRFTSATEFAYVDKSDTISGTYTREGGNYTLNVDNMGDTYAIYGRATDGDFYVPRYAVCNITVIGSFTSTEGESGPIPTLNADLSDKYDGDTVVVQVFEVRYEGG